VAGAARAVGKEGRTSFPRSFPFVLPLAAAAPAAPTAAVVDVVDVVDVADVRTATIHWTIASTARAKPTWRLSCEACLKYK
jgi:hypothetical protein